jgi:hypothetical protein
MAPWCTRKTGSILPSAVSEDSDKWTEAWKAEKWGQYWEVPVMKKL